MIRVLLVVVFIVVPLLELAIIITVGDLIGVWPTVALLLIDSLIGAWLVRREGLRAWQRFRAALGTARVPTDEVIEGALVLFGGALLLTPGFATDAAGLALLIPPTRALVASAIKRQVGSRFTVSTLGGAGTSSARTRSGVPGPTARRRPSDEVVDVEVVNVERTPRDSD